MTRRRPIRCSCDACARLDLSFPGEGMQLALPIHIPARRQLVRRGLQEARS